MVPGRTLLILVSLFFLLFIYCGQQTFGETNHDASRGGVLGETQVRRLSPGEKLDEETATVLATAFKVPKSLVLSRYQDSLPRAVEAAVTNKDEKEVASIVSELFGTINSKQLDGVLSAAKEALQKEQEKTPRKPLNVALFERIITAAESLKNEEYDPQNEQLVAFLKEFDRSFEDVKKSNALFHEKLSQALGGNAKAQEFLRTNYDPEGLLAFLDSQRESGNRELARNLAKAISTKEASGNHLLDMIGPGGQRERLPLGSSNEEVDRALDQFAGRTGFPGRRISSTPHASVDVTHPKAEAAPPSAQPKESAPPQGPLSQPGPTAAKEEVTPPKNPVNSVEAAALEVLRSQCVRCHGPDGKNKRAFEMDATGQPVPRNKETVERILARAVIDGDMPEDGELTAAQKDILRTWAAEQGVVP